MEIQRKPKRTFTPDQKFELIQDIDKAPIKIIALKKHNITHSMYMRWKRQLEVGISSSLRGGRGAPDSVQRQLKSDNKRLMEIILNLTAQLADLKKEMRLD